MTAAALANPVPTIQPPVPEASRRADSVIGEVTAVDAGSGRLPVKTDAGALLEVRADEETAFWKARPGSSTLNDTAPVPLADVAVGDRVLARGRIDRADREPPPDLVDLGMSIP